MRRVIFPEDAAEMQRVPSNMLLSIGCQTVRLDIVHNSTRALCGVRRVLFLGAAGQMQRIPSKNAAFHDPPCIDVAEMHILTYDSI